MNRRSGDAGPDWVIERNYMAAGGKGVSFPIASRACDDERAGVVWLYRRHGKVIGVCPGMSFCGESSLAALDYCSMVHDWLYCSIEYCGPPRPGSSEWRPRLGRAVGAAQGGSPLPSAGATEIFSRAE